MNSERRGREIAGQAALVEGRLVPLAVQLLKCVGAVPITLFESGNVMARRGGLLCCNLEEMYSETVPELRRVADEMDVLAKMLREQAEGEG